MKLLHIRNESKESDFEIVAKKNKKKEKILGKTGYEIIFGINYKIYFVKRNSC
jgi:hypothetical protein